MIVRKISCLSVALWMGLQPLAQADELAEAYAQGLDLFRAENYTEALPFFQEALALAEERYGSQDARLAVELNNLAEVYRLMGDYEQAEPLYRRALELDEANLASDDPDLATSLNNLALLYRAQNRLDEAEALYERSLNILQEALGPRHPNVAKSLNNLAVLYDAQGRSAEAATLIERAVGIAEETLGGDHPTTVTLASNLESIGGGAAGGASVSAELEGQDGAESGPPPLPAIADAQGVGSSSEADGGAQDSTQLAASQGEGDTGEVVPQIAAIEPAAGGEFVIHLASVRAPDEAQAEWRRLVQAYGLPADLPQVEPAKVATDSGDFYRVWGGGFVNRGDAEAQCASVEAQGEYCRVMSIR